MAASWQRLGDAVGCTGIGVNRVQIEPGRLSTPPHSHGASEEIVFVLGGSGLSWQDEQVYELRPGDCIVHLADHEEQAEPLEFGEPAPRPKNIVNVEDAEAEEWERADCGCVERPLGRIAGSVKTGMRHEVVPSGKLNCPPHCHGSEEEFFVVLDGEGTCLLGDEEHSVRRGSIIGRPPGTGVAHAFRGPLTLLTYGTNEPNEICYYPRSNKIAFFGAGVIGRIEKLDYWDGEPPE